MTTHTLPDRPDEHSPWSGDSDLHLNYVVKLHQANRLHYDLRLELDGVLLSWVLDEMPSLDPEVRLRAVQVDDHPVQYMLAEKRIPPGRFGAGPMIVWDHGKYGPYPADASVHEKPLREGFNEGRLKLILHGVRLHGAWSLELHGKEWAFAKLDDRFASETQPDWDHRSVLSNKSLSDVEQEWRRRMGIA